jgi:hypothetical protein
MAGSISAAHDQETAMAKGQQRSNREKKKPKQPPKPIAPAAPGVPWKK